MKVKIRSFNNMSTVESLGKEKINKISNKINNFYKKEERQMRLVTSLEKTEHLYQNLIYTLNPDVKEFCCIISVCSDILEYESLR